MTILTVRITTAFGTTYEQSYICDDGSEVIQRLDALNKSEEVHSIVVLGVWHV